MATSLIAVAVLRKKLHQQNKRMGKRSKNIRHNMTGRHSDLTDLVWQNTRKVILERDGYKCVICGVSEGLHVHHLIPRHLGGTDEPANLITLCAACHASRHTNLQVSLSRRFIERWALRLAMLFDYDNELPKNTEHLALALRIMGKDRFRDGQLDIVLAALRRESLLAVLPTGSGKTLCFQLPALLTPGTAFVLSPLKALMSDQISDLQNLRIPATFINSDLNLAEKSARYNLLEKGVFKLLYVTPERFDVNVVYNKNDAIRLQRTKPSFLVVDEAHCVDRWGDDFRPAYGRIRALRADIGNPPTLAFTATAGTKAQRRILDAIGEPNARVIVAGVDRTNIALIRHETRSLAERSKITKNLVLSANGKVMIFVPTRRIGVEVYKALKRVGLDVPFYHSQLSSVDRDFLLHRFTGQIQPEIDTIICTNAFGMGIDIPNVRVVIHWVQPESVEDYLQEFGRAGRDGKPSIALIFKEHEDTGVRRFMAQKTLEQASERGIDGKSAYTRKLDSIDELDRMIRNRKMCFRKQIIGYFQTGPQKKRSLAIRILEWFLGSRKRIQKAKFCCDACNAAMAWRIINGRGVL